MAHNAEFYDMEDNEKAWCPGCGHFAMQKILRIALSELDVDPTKLVLVSGIGQAAKTPQYTKGNMFNGLHGRSLPPAMAIKAANPELTVVVDSGDGCTYGEGGNHFIHQIIRNSDITDIVHNNQIYGLTKGQASPTSLKGMVTPVQYFGVTNEPINPLALAISLGAGFVARIFVGDVERSVEIVKKAIQHKGYALVDAFSPCVSMNKLNTYKWYKDRVYYLEEDYDPSNKVDAFKKVQEIDKFPLGLFYLDESRKCFWEESVAYQSDKSPLYKRDVDLVKLKKLIESKRVR
jgi:2-oxoglutarate/2-oxoacid ferredoxin oxidoreductase subunit beta